MIEEISSTMLDPAAFHRSLLTLDSHIDIPWPESKDPFTESERAVDFPKMRRGGLWAGCLAAYVPQTLRTPENREQAVARAEAMLQAIHSMGRTQDGIRVRVTARAADVEAAWREGVIAVIPVIENGHALGGDPGNLAHFRKLGVCYLTLTHNGHNDLADSAIPKRELGDGEA